MDDAKVSAVIVAGGTGSRMGAKCPKQFLKIHGSTVIEHTVNRFIKSGVIDEFVIVCHEEYIGYVSEIFANKTVKVSVVKGADTRQKSVMCGLETVSTEYVLIHDAVRCCIDPYKIKEIVDALRSYNACALGVKVIDTVKKTDLSNVIIETVERDNLWLIQTPQAFVTELICDAHKKAVSDGFSATDDCAVAEYAGHSVKIIEGSYQNIKLTTPADMILVSEYLKG